DADEVLFVELVERGEHRQAADELGDEAELDEVLGHHAVEQVAGLVLLLLADVGAEAHGLLVEPALDLLGQADEGAAADEEDVGGVDLQELLVRVLAAALRRHVAHRPLEDLQQRLLHALAGDVAGDRRVVALATDLVHLVEVDDALLRLFLVVPRRLVELENDVLDVLADVAGLGEGGGVGDGERDVEDLGEGLREQRLAGAGRPDQQDVALLQLDVGAHALGVLDALVVVVDRDGELLLRLLLADDVLVEQLLELVRLGEVRLLLLLEHPVLGNDVEADVDALVADEDRRSGDELAHLALALVAERAAQGVVAGFALGHLSSGWVLWLATGLCVLD